MNSFFQSKTFKVVLWGLVILVAVLVVFNVGMAVGFRKAAYSYQFGDNYHLNLGGPEHGIVGDYMGGGFTSGHGIFGQIVSIASTSIAVETSDHLEKVVVIDPQTRIERLRDVITPADLHIDDSVVIIGSPDNQGEIHAEIIRVLPAGSSPGLPNDPGGGNASATPASASPY